MNDRKVPQCHNCRFWHPKAEDMAELQEGGTTFGFCRVRAPQLITPLVEVSMGKLAFGQQRDIDEIFDVMQVYDATSFPATFGTSWCGEFEWIPRLAPLETPC